jgi:hypothetical protein
MPGANANRDYKVKPVVTCHAENPTATEGISHIFSSHLLASMKKGRMSGPVFTLWFNDQLHCELQAYCKAKCMDFACAG